MRREASGFRAQASGKDRNAGLQIDAFDSFAQTSFHAGRVHGQSLAGCSLSLPAGYEAIEIVPTRPDVTVRLLVIKGNSKPTTALILFPGADGTKHFGEKDGRFWVGNNFLMRSARDLAAAGYIVVAVDAPSDQS